MIWCALVTLLVPVDGLGVDSSSKTPVVKTSPSTVHRLYKLEEGDRLQVLTERHIIRLRVVDALQDEYIGSITRQGSAAPNEQAIFVFGSTKGRKRDGILVVRSGTLEVGKCLEVGMGSRRKNDRFLTDPIRSVQLLK